MTKKLGIISACIISLLTTPIIASAETSSATSSEKKEQIETDLSEVKEEKLQVQEEILTITEALDSMNEQIETSNRDIANKKTKLTEIKHEIDRLTSEEQRITALLTSRQAEFKDRVSSYYRTEGQMSFLNVILSANSFGEFIDHSVSYQTIVNEDKTFIEAYIADQNNIATIKANVETLQESTIQEKKSLESIKKSQETKKKEKEKLANMLKKKRKQLEKEENKKEEALKLLQDNEQKILDAVNRTDSSDNNPVVQSVIAPFITDAQKLQQEKGIPASIILSQIILESSGKYNGLSGLAYEAKNLFGVKGSGTAGSVYMNTTEYINGKKITSKEKFAKYETYYDSMLAHSNLLLKPRYQKYLQYATTVSDYAHGIHDAGYATDPNYANLVLNIIDRYNLEAFDQ